MFIEIVCFIILASPQTAQETDGNSNRLEKPSCILPSQPDHGMYITNIPNGTPGHSFDFIVVNTTCQEGYVVEGSEYVYCYHGRWTEPQPTCVFEASLSDRLLDDDSSKRQRSCMVPKHPDHGTYEIDIPNGRPGVMNDFIVINITCHQNYRVEGSVSVYCFRGRWSEQKPTCVSVPFGLSISTPVADDKRKQNDNRCILPQYPGHGTYSAAIPNESAKPGEAYDIVAVNVTCQEGYVANGPHLVFCANGSWTTKLPECVPQCKLVPHPSVEYYCLVSSQWMDQVSYRPCNDFEPSGTSVSPSCRMHYYSTTGLKTMHCVDGEWSTIQTCTPECGTLIPAGTQLIINGTNAKLGEVPWHAAIYTTKKKPYSLICGGSLISTNIVISAAHCFWNSLVGQLPASDYIVAVGKQYRDSDNTMEEPQWSRVKAIRMPKRFRGSETSFQDDVAVLELTTAVQYQTHIRPVCLNFDEIFERRQLQTGKKGKVAGWGLKTEDGIPAQQLQVVDLPYVPIDTCYDKVPPTFKAFITSDKICAGYHNGGTAVCMGDSGGGLAFFELDKGTPRYYLRGVVSTAPTSDSACNANTYTTFTRLLKHENFITRFWRD